VSAWREIGVEYLAIRPMELAAALSYYTLLSLAPLVLLTVALAGLVFERGHVEGRVVAEIRALVGDDGAEVVQTVLRHSSDPEKGLISVLVGAAFLLVGATTVFVELQQALNRIWKVDRPWHPGALRSLLKERVLSFAMVLAIGFLLLVSLLANTALTAVGDSARATVGEAPAALAAANTALSLVVIGLLFAAMFKALPDAPVAWRDVWFGAAVTSALFVAGKHALGLYLGRAGIGSAYGAAGSLVVVTVWVYYAALIVFLGAEITYVRARRRAPAARS